MNRSLLFTVSFLALTACGVTEAQLDENSNDVSADEAELGTVTRTYVVMRRDFRRCAWPMCSGYFIHDVNRASLREVYVPGLDFSQSGLTEDQQNIAKGAGSFEVVLYGKLGALENGYRNFVVTSAWRGMPGVTFDDAADTFYRAESVAIQCITAPCPSLQASKLHSASKILFHDLSVEHAAKPFVDQDYLTFRVTDKDALVAGRFVNGAGREKILSASQIFVKLPERTNSCPRPSIALCPSPKVNVWVRDMNRCTMPAGCAAPGACAASVPACDPGYSLVSWTGGPHACTQYVCDADFLLGL